MRVFAPGDKGVENALVLGYFPYNVCGLGDRACRLGGVRPFPGGSFHHYRQYRDVCLGRGSFDHEAFVGTA